ncbi:MAG: caspase family protein [Sulfuritalea sp.]|nr:caspase family protein [Sulfuritalea sp.]
MQRFRWFSFLVLVGIQGIFSGLGGSAEPTRTLTVAAAQEKGGRVAIVIGNSNYPSGALTNPKNDATVMAGALKKLGFDVELKLDATKADIDGMLRRFSGKAEKATVAALFYAGHGIQVGGSNYLVPIDANPRSEKDLKRDMVRMDDVIDDMGDARVKLVFFDACRDNPLSRSFSRGAARGMAAPVEATGTLISFATKHGNTAADGDGKHSPYTNALLAALENPAGVEIEQLLRRVQQGVKAETKGQQEPWRYGSLDGDFYFKPADPTDNSKAQQEAVERAVLDAMRRTNEQAAKEKAELQQTLKAQQAANDRAMAEALKKAGEQAAKERAEMQASMDRMLKEALAKQNAALEAERAARLAATGAPAPVAAPVAVVAQVQKPIAEKPIQLASIAPTINAGAGSKPSEQMLASLSSAAGDEWEYLASDELFGKKQKLVLRVKAASSDGVLEEIVWNGKPALDWVFGEQAMALATPNESEFMFAPHWNGNEFPELLIEGGKSLCTASGSFCRLSLKIAGNEKLTVAAGTFDAIRLEGWIRMGNAMGSVTGPVTVWYSKEQRRLLKQSAQLMGNRTKFKETLELSAIRRGPR